MRRGRIERPVLESRALRDNPLGDPHAREVPVWLPPAYDAEPARRFPVLFVLAGFTGRGSMMLNDALWSEPLDRRLDRLVSEGCPEAIVVMPDCTTRWGGSQYVDSEATGRYEEHVAEELVSWVDERYRTIPGARAVMGKSSGGYGTLSLLLRRPGVFRAGACHSGDVYFEHCYFREFAEAANILRARGGLQQFLDDFPAMTNKSGKDVMHVINTVAMASCYSPEAGQPHGIALPFDVETGEILPDVWARWLERDPVRMVEARSDGLRDLDLLFIDCGTKDEFALHLGARILVRRLGELGVSHEHEEFDDGHFSITYRFDTSIPKLLKAIAP